MKNIYIVTGGPGFGKTSLLNELRERGFNSSEELSRQFIKEQMEKDGTLLPWVDRLGYSREMLSRRINQYVNTPDNDLWFFDRGIPDLIAYIIKDGLEVSDVYYKSAQEYRYAQTVFLTPPWKDIHKNDSERLETFEEAVTIHNEVEKTYKSQGYECINLPKTTIKERAKFVLETIGEMGSATMLWHSLSMSYI